MRRSLSAEEAMAQAKQLTRAGNHAAAANLYQHILAQYPANKKARKALKAIQERVGGNSREERLKTDMNKLMQLYSSGSHDHAFSHATRLTKVYPEQPVPPNIMGVILASRGEMQAAVECYQKALQADPSYVEAINNLGAAFRKLKDYDRALSCFQRLIDLTPGDSDLYYNLGNALLDAGEPHDAVIAYERAISIRPLHSLSHKQLGVALSSAGQPVQAIASLRSAINIDPKMVDAHFLIGELFQSQGLFDKAIESFQQAAELQPDNPMVHLRLEAAMLELDQRDKPQ